MAYRYKSNSLFFAFLFLFMWKPLVVISTQILLYNPEIPKIEKLKLNSVKYRKLLEIAVVQLRRPQYSFIKYRALTLGHRKSNLMKTSLSKTIMFPI